jgi:hypothetical protein
VVPILSMVEGLLQGLHKQVGIFASVKWKFKEGSFFFRLPSFCGLFSHSIVDSNIRGAYSLSSYV